MHKTTDIACRKLGKTIKMVAACEDTFDFSRWTVHNISESVQPGRAASPGLCGPGCIGMHRPAFELPFAIDNRRGKGYNFNDY